MPARRAARVGPAQTQHLPPAAPHGVDFDRPTEPADLGPPVGIPAGEARELAPADGMREFADAWRRWRGAGR